MNILIPIDFSQNSEVALKYAIDFAKRVKGQITLFNAYEVANMESVSINALSDFTNGPSGRLQQKVEDDKLHQVESKLQNLAEANNLEAGSYKCIAAKGNIKTEVDNVLNSEKYDLVVLGTRGENTQKGLFFGGIASHLIKTSNCPVLAVPFETEYQDVKRIVYPTDLAHSEMKNLTWLIEYARLHNAYLHLLHITEDESPEKLEKIKELTDELSYDHLTYEVVPGFDVSDIIVGYSRDNKADMISMTTHTTTLFDHIFHSSFTADVLDKINVPFIGFSTTDTNPFPSK